MEVFTDLHGIGVFDTGFLDSGDIKSPPGSFMNDSMPTAFMPSLALHQDDERDDSGSGSETLSDISGSSSPLMSNDYHQQLDLLSEQRGHMYMPTEQSNPLLSVSAPIPVDIMAQPAAVPQPVTHMSVQQQVQAMQATVEVQEQPPAPEPKQSRTRVKSEKRADTEAAAPVRKRTRKLPARKRKAPAATTRSPSPTPAPKRRGKKAKSEANKGEMESLMEEQILKRKRLARKAELARLSRRKKKLRLVDLEAEVKQLEDKIEASAAKHRSELEQSRARTAQLEMQLAEARRNANKPVAAAPAAAPAAEVAAPAAAELAQSNRILQSAIKTMMAGYKSGASQDQLSGLVTDVVSTFQSRTTASQYHLNQVEDSMTTCLPLQFLEWLMSQNERFYEDPSGLWHSLLNQELEASPQQIEQMLSLRTGEKHKPSSELRTAFGVFNNLLREHLSTTLSTVTKMSEIFTPQQSIKFFEWVNRFGGVCVKINL